MYDMSSKRECPICHKEFANFLKHLRITHEIKNDVYYKKKMQEIEETNIKKEKFRNYTEEHQKRMKNGEITPEEYRELITKWNKDNP